MDGRYAWEKMHAAVHTLATGTGSLRERLEDAYVSSLILLRPDHHFPWSDLRQRFENLAQELAPNGRFDLALGTWPDDDLQRIAGNIVSLYDRIGYVIAALDEDESSEAWQARQEAWQARQNTKLH